MGEVTVSKLLEVLSSGEEPIAKASFAGFLASIRADAPELASEAGVEDGLLKSAGSNVERATWNEARDVLLDAFSHLSGVVCLALLVDEPGLIAEDVRWLYRWLLAKKITIPYDTMTSALFQSYLEACRPRLSHGELALVQNLLDNSAQLLASGRPES